MNSLVFYCFGFIIDLVFSISSGSIGSMSVLYKPEWMFKRIDYIIIKYFDLHTTLSGKNCLIFVETIELIGKNNFEGLFPFPPQEMGSKLRRFIYFRK